MYERFTDRARKVFQLANQEAQRFGDQYIRPAHVVIAMMKEGSGIAWHVLKSAGLDLGRVRREAEKSLPLGTENPLLGKMPHTPETKLIVEKAIEAARTRDHDWVGTEHLLLGSMEAPEAHSVLTACGADVSKFPAAVEALLKDRPPATGPAPVILAHSTLGDQSRAAWLRELAHRLLAEAESLSPTPKGFHFERVGTGTVGESFKAHAAHRRAWEGFPVVGQATATETHSAEMADLPHILPRADHKPPG